MSLRASKAIATTSNRRPRPPIWTWVARCPATTWALVATSPGAATQPEPLDRRPHAVPMTRTTEARAKRTLGSRAMPRGTCGSSRDGIRAGNGSQESSRSRSEALEGSAGHSRPRTSDSRTAWAAAGGTSPRRAAPAASHATTQTTTALKTAPSRRSRPIGAVRSSRANRPAPARERRGHRARTPRAARPSSAEPSQSADQRQNGGRRGGGGRRQRGAEQEAD